MYKILKKKWLSKNICLMEVEAKDLSLSAKPGQFLIVKKDEFGERIPLTICDYDVEKGTVTIVFFVLGKSTKDIGTLEEGEYFQDVVGPLGVESQVSYNKEDYFVAYKIAKKLGIENLKEDKNLKNKIVISTGE